MHQLIYGNEPYLLNQTLEQKIHHLIGQADAMNHVIYSATDADFSIFRVIEEALTLTFFSNHKIIQIRNASFLTRGVAFTDSEYKELSRYFKEPNDSCSLFFIHDDDNLDTNKKVTKLVLEHAEVTHVKKYQTEAFRQHMTRRFSQNHMRITIDAFDEFLRRVDNNLGIAYQELEKLRLYQSSIELKDVEALVSRPLDSEAFHLVNALMDKNLKTALSIFNDMMLLNMDPLSFSGLIASQLRLLYQVSLLDKAGHHREDMINRLSDNQKINVYRLNRLLQLSRQTSPNRILSILNHLAEYDQNTKQGRLEKRFGFELFIIEASH